MKQRILQFLHEGETYEYAATSWRHLWRSLAYTFFCWLVMGFAAIVLSGVVIKLITLFK